MSTTLSHPGGAPPPLVTPRDTPLDTPLVTTRVTAQPETRTLCRAAASSFAVGLVGLRLCWLPGVNCILAFTAVVFGVVALWQILRSRGAMSGIDEAISGIVLGVVVLGLSVFFLSALIAAWR